MEKRESTISSLRFINYIVNDVKFKSNKIQDDKKVLKLTFDIVNSTKVNKERDKMEIILKSIILNLYQLVQMDILSYLI